VCRKKGIPVFKNVATRYTEVDKYARAVVFFHEPTDAYMIKLLVSQLARSITQIRRKRATPRIILVAIVSYDMHRSVNTDVALNQLLSLNYPEGARQAILRFFLTGIDPPERIIDFSIAAHRSHLPRVETPRGEKKTRDSSFNCKNPHPIHVSTY